MLAQIRRNGFASAKTLLALSATLILASCASKEEPQLFSERQAGKRDSALPWNEQKTWETQGQFGPMAEHYGDGRH